MNTIKQPKQRYQINTINTVNTAVIEQTFSPAKADRQTKFGEVKQNKL